MTSVWGMEYSGLQRVSAVWDGSFDTGGGVGRDSRGGEEAAAGRQEGQQEEVIQAAQGGQAADS